MPTYINLTPGDPAPWFRQRSFGNPRYTFDTSAGRYLVLCFYGSANNAYTRAALAAVAARRDLFDDEFASFFGVSLDPSDETQQRVKDFYPGFRHFWDFDGAVSRLYGAVPNDHTGDLRQAQVRRLWVVLDPMMRVMATFPFTREAQEIAAVLAFVEAAPPVDQVCGFAMQAPVLVLGNVFEPAFCRRVIDAYEADGGRESGFMREIDGRTVEVHDQNHKRRRDYLIEDPALVAETQARFKRRVVPMIARAHQFEATRMERYVVSCYAAEDKAHFRAHRDNTTKGTAHRRFAVSVNLNSDFDGGEVSFPEFGPRSYKAPVGGAVVFSCSLLHAVSPVTRGRRFAFLPFLYDDAAARIREANVKFINDGEGAYKSGLE